MQIKSIKLHSFRNIENQEINLHPELNLFIGNNGQGKTNILESVHMLSSLKSFRRSKISELISHGKRKSKLIAVVKSVGIELELRLELDSSGRKVWVGSEQVRSISDYLGKLAVVAFTPDDLAMVKGPPSNRRGFMDRSIFLLNRSHLETVSNFNLSLKSRNKILSSEKIDEQVLRGFTHTLSKWGWILSKNRKDLLDRLQDNFSETIRKLSKGSLDAKLEFVCGWKDGPGPDSNHLLEKLDNVYDRDRFRKMTTLGPQLDDFNILLNDQRARKFGSQGQQRSCALALLLSTVDLLTKQGMERPIILMDDVSSELDADVRKRLFEIIMNYRTQTIVTTTEESLVKDLSPQRVFRVENGEVRVES